MNDEPKLIPTGALLDYRTEDEKAKDWLHEELFAGAAPSEWKEKTIADVKRHTPRDQGSSLSCVANGIAIALENAEKQESGVTRVFSHKDVYIRRSNKPYGGMGMDDAFRIMREGAAFEGQVPSMGLSETPINQSYPVTDAIKQIRATYAALSTVIMQQPTFDKIAAVLDMNITLTAFWFFSNRFAYQEWWNKRATITDPSLTLFADDAAHHQVQIIDYGTMNGEKVLFGQDSAGVGTGNGEYGDIRVIPLDFFTKRNYAVGYGIDKKNLDFNVPQKPSFKFTRSLSQGMSGNDVAALQEILVYEGLMILNKPTGYFGGATLAAVKKYQQKYAADILTPLGLKVPTGKVAAMTIKKLNSDYAPQ